MAPADTWPRVIGLVGPAGCGKSTAAAFLGQMGFERIRFAGPLKAMFAALLAAADLPEGEIARMIEGDLKEAPHPALRGKSPRLAMQTLGTEWGRTCLALDFWVHLTWRRMVSILADGGRVVIEDCRFPNEAEAILGAHHTAEIWAITGRGGIAGDHASEAGLAGLEPDRVLDNSGTYAEFLDRIRAALDRA